MLRPSIVGRKRQSLEDRSGKTLEWRFGGRESGELVNADAVAEKKLAGDSRLTRDAYLEGETYFCPGGLAAFLSSMDEPDLPARDGAVFIAVDPLELPEWSTALLAVESAVSQYELSSHSPQALTNIFLLHSKANAKHVIYLDFTGHTTSGTLWNQSYNNGKSFTTPAFTLDGSSSFSSAEEAMMRDIWRRVAEDFRPFDVDVTTQLPSGSQLIKSGDSDDRWGIRVVIGGEPDWLGFSSAGIAYEDSFNWNSDTPAFVFSGGFAISDKNVAEAISHETGHTLGLTHDGRTSPSEEYYTGHGSGETGWAPLMGLGYYQNVTQWDNGEYNNANNSQDDLKVITTQNGFGYRDDDHGNSVDQATILKLEDNNLVETGIIERNTDSDFFSFGIQTSGKYQMNVMTFFKGPNLDLAVTLYNENGDVLKWFNPNDQLSVTSREHLVAGQYFMRVLGVGASGSNGYSDYGSLGSYSVRIIPIDIDITEPTVQIYQRSAAKPEGDSGTSYFSFQLIRQGNLKIETTVDWSVHGVDAPNTVDRFDFKNNVFASGTAKFEFGSHFTIIYVAVKTDLVWEPHERMEVLIENAVNGRITKSTVVGTIYNDDSYGGNALTQPAAFSDGADLLVGNRVDLTLDPVASNSLATAAVGQQVSDSLLVDGQRAVVASDTTTSLLADSADAMGMLATS